MAGQPAALQLGDEHVPQAAGAGTGFAAHALRAHAFAKGPKPASRQCGCTAEPQPVWQSLPRLQPCKSLPESPTPAEAAGKKGSLRVGLQQLRTRAVALPDRTEACWSGKLTPSAQISRQEDPAVCCAKGQNAHRGRFGLRGAVYTQEKRSQLGAGTQELLKRLGFSPPFVLAEPMVLVPAAVLFRSMLGISMAMWHVMLFYARCLGYVTVGGQRGFRFPRRVRISGIEK